MLETFWENVMTDESWLNAGKGPSDNEIAIDYVKAPDFRVVWADGAIGSVTPNGLIHFSLYAERQAIPRRQVFALEVEGNVGRLGKEVLEKQISRGSIVREMSFDVFLTAQSAENLALWLNSQSAELKKIKDEDK
jgi:hypothetical protein